MNNSVQCEEVHNVVYFSTTTYINASSFFDGGEKVLLTSGLFAGVTKDSFVAPQRLNTGSLSKKHGNYFNFCCWFIGVTDSDGGFFIEKSGENKFVWSFYIDQQYYNIKLLIYIRSVLGVGSVDNTGKFMYKFRIRDRSILKAVIIPIFTQLPLLTSKMKRFKLWLKAMQIWEDTSLSKEDRVKTVLNIKEQMTYITQDYKSSAFDILPIEASVEVLNNFYNSHWVAGFIEGDGSFYIVKKSSDRYVPGFAILQKLDVHILEHLKKIFHISAKIRHTCTFATTFYLLDTTNARSLTNILNYFSNYLISMKYTEYKIWARALHYNNSPGRNYKKILHCRNLLKKFRDKSI
jgi:hypothetical protein